MTLTRSLRILVFGKDARTDAVVAACRKSRWCAHLAVFSQFKIPGMVRAADTFETGDLTDVAAMVEFARQVAPDLVIVGPEEPLEVGLVDALLAMGVPCFGPPQALAMIETSKTWTRELVKSHSIPGNPRYRILDGKDQVEPVFQEFGEFVVKPDGLTGGKGVRVYPEHFTDSDNPLEEAIDYAQGLIEEGGVALVEERLDGEEFSLQTVTDGETFVHFPLVQDHKRAFDGDSGPNTGGMGSYSCADFSLPFLEGDEADQARRINELVAAAIEEETGHPYRGVLYGGFMATADGVRLIEYNARFGDPEALNVLTLLDADFVELAYGTAVGSLGDVKVRFGHRATVCKYVVPEHYPSGKGAGDPITVDPEVETAPGVGLFWAATDLTKDGVLMTGSRALAVVGVGDCLQAAEERAEWAASRVSGDVRYRTDIGTPELIEKRISHMRHLRSGD